MQTPALPARRARYAHAVALLLTGRPGAGKTTVLRAAAQQLTGLRLAGFYTEEIRVRGERRASSS